MKAMTDALVKAGQFILTNHARERIRQRVGITSDSAAIAWVADQVKNAINVKHDGGKMHYLTDAFEIVCDGARVVTVKPAEFANKYLSEFKSVLIRETTKLLTKYERELRKAEIAVAEAQLNFLKARNPKIKEIIQRKLTDAIDYKAAVEDEIKAIKIAASRYGVSSE
jgi:hypothetical protein